MNRRGFMAGFAGLAAFLPWKWLKIPADTIPTEVIQQEFVQFNPPGSFRVTKRINSDFLMEIITVGTTKRNEHGYYQVGAYVYGFVRVSADFKEDVFGKTLEYKIVDREIPKPNRAGRG